MLTRFLALPLSTRIAVGVWAALLVGVGGRVLVANPRSGTVVPIYLAAGERWTAGEDLYAPHPGLDVYRNPPGVAAAFVPLTSLPEKVAGVLWRLLGAAVFLVGLGRFRRDVVPDLSPTRAGVMFALAAVVVLPAVNNGQVNLLIAGAVLNGTAATARRRWWEAAGWFGLGGWLKVYPLAAGLLAAVVHPRQLGPRLLAMSTAGFLAPFLLHDPAYVLGQYHSFLAYLGADDRTYAALSRVPRDWTILPRVWLDCVPTPAVSKVVSVLAGVGAAGLVVRRGSLVLAAVLGSVWMTVFGPATESNTFALLAGPAAYLVVAPSGRWGRMLAGVGYGLLAVTVLRGMFPEDWRFQAYGPQPVGAVLLAVAGWVMVRPGNRRGPVVWVVTQHHCTVAAVVGRTTSVGRAGWLRFGSGSWATSGGSAATPPPARATGNGATGTSP